MEIGGERLDLRKASTCFTTLSAWKLFVARKKAYKRIKINNRLNSK
jgi:hypothetical protein